MRVYCLQHADDDRDEQQRDEQGEPDDAEVGERLHVEDLDAVGMCGCGAERRDVREARVRRGKLASERRGDRPRLRSDADDRVCV